MKILLVEDNAAIAKQTTEFLEGLSWQVDYAHSGKLGIELALNEIFDLILLDLNLPDLDGLEVCKSIKEKATANVPVLMLTARDSFEDKSAGFTLGADDYLTKPFDFRELALRCKALAKRRDLHLAKKQALGELVIDISNKTVRRMGKSIQLTQVGFEILSLLVQHHPNAVPRSLMIYEIWSDSPPDSDALKSHIYSLRQAIDKPFSYPMIKTVMNLGYRLEIEK